MSRSRADVLGQELKALIEAQSMVRLAKLKGQIEWIARTNTNHLTTAETWVLRAQLGTVEKYKELYAISGLQDGVALVALARNAFENLIWLKLFNQDRHYGLVFYKQLLKQQLDSQEQAITKAHEEISLFKELEKEDTPNFDPVMHLLTKKEHPEEDALAIREHLQSQQDLVDAKARAAFSVYAEQARENGYGFQAHIIESKAIPQHLEHIETLNRHMDDLRRAIPTDLTPSMQRELGDKARWKWAEQATRVGMESHYKFLYSFTSRLLHATPMSLITPKNLDEAESCLLLDYLCLAVKTSYEEIEKFTYPGQINIVLLADDQ